MTTRSWVPSAVTSAVVASNAVSPPVISARLTVAEVGAAAEKAAHRAAGATSQLLSRPPLSVGGELGAFKLPPSAARNLLRVSATVRLSPWARITAKLGPGGALLLGE